MNEAIGARQYRPRRSNPSKKSILLYYLMERSIWERFGFAILVGLLQCFGITSLILVAVWLGKYHDGFAWDGSGKQFNYHPVCMVLSMVFLSGEGT